MGDSIVVQVAVGLALIFLVLATLVSALTELMSKVFRVRAKTLWKSLAGLLNPPAVKTYGPPEGTSTDFGLAAGLKMVTNDPRPTGALGGNHTITTDLAMTPSVRAFDPTADPKKPTQVAQLPPRVFAAALLELAEIKGESGSVAARIRKLTTEYGDAPLAQYLATIAAGVGDDVDRFVDQVGGWFDAQMTRLTAVYKRWATLILFVIGLVVALGLNADAIEMGIALKENTQTRTALALVADSVAGSDVSAMCTRPAEPAEPAETSGTSSDGDSGTADYIDLRCASQAVGKLEELRIPVLGNWSWQRWLDSWTEGGLLGGVTHGAGLLITAMALAMGAPFWFDLLGLLTGKRRQ